MEQYKVILVDDEVEVIDVMKKKIRWNDLGFDVVGSATNGVKALELVEKTAKAQDLDFLSSKKSSTLTTRPLMSSVLKASELNLSLLWKKQNKNKNTAENLFFNY